MTSLPKLFGITDGVSLTIGSMGRFALYLRRHPLHKDAAPKPMDRGFIAQRFLTAGRGLALMNSRRTGALPLRCVCICDV